MEPASLLAPGGDREAATDLSTANEASTADPVPARLYPNTESRGFVRAGGPKGAVSTGSALDGAEGHGRQVDIVRPWV
jgi:hypothetical protein